MADNTEHAWGSTERQQKS